ncbi:hypothetical protein C5E45_08985 [Nocardia nova]|uniref:Uncharacterized protein n=2 Tax=Nocardia nova TaxID=37330 RepID=A0A2S6AT88_9NOCA|nr:hypothetical protein [Nocardia nova]PPJ26075.1 hypothetical protein C5E41_18220 [Nocardia nova]PPJ38409.1 hypothetical protein C5E45_08985 [Nocardia nova]
MSSPTGEFVLGVGTHAVLCNLVTTAIHARAVRDLAVFFDTLRPPALTTVAGAVAASSVSAEESSSGAGSSAAAAEPTVGMPAERAGNYRRR